MDEITGHHICYYTIVPALKPPRRSAAVDCEGGGVVVVRLLAVVVVDQGWVVEVSLVGGAQESRLGYWGPDQQPSQLVYRYIN